MRRLALSLVILILSPVASGQTALRPGSQAVPWPSPNTPDPTVSTLQEAKVLVVQPVVAKDDSQAKKNNGNAASAPQTLADLFNQALMQRPGASGGAYNQTAGVSSNIANADLRDCGDKKPDLNALDTMISCANRKLSMASNAKGALVDVDQKVMFIVNRGTREVEGCVNISTAKSTGAGIGQTPLGMMITGSHDGGKYQSNADGTSADCIGLLAGNSNDVDIRQSIDF